jgi:hypothetical protein
MPSPALRAGQARENALDIIVRVCFNNGLDFEGMKRRVSGVSMSPKAWTIVTDVAEVVRRVGVIIVITGD